MKKFSVLLLVPDYLAQTYGQDTFFTCVSATGAQQAIAKAQFEANEKHEVADVGDFFPLFVTEGEHRNIKDQV